MQPVHDRMPVCLPEIVLHDWLFDAGRAWDILKAEKCNYDVNLPSIFVGQD